MKGVTTENALYREPAPSKHAMALNGFYPVFGARGGEAARSNATTVAHPTMIWRKGVLVEPNETNDGATSE